MILEPVRSRIGVLFQNEHIHFMRGYVVSIL